MPDNFTSTNLYNLPEGDLKNILTGFLENQKSLVSSINVLQKELETLSGITPEEKQETYHAMKQLRTLFNQLHSARFNLTLMGLQAYLAISIFKQLELNPEQATRLINTLIKIVEKFT